MNTENTWVGRVANRSVNGSCRNKKERKERENNKTALEKKKVALTSLTAYDKKKPPRVVGWNTQSRKPKTINTY